MKRSYWENMAPKYADEIFDVLHNDKKALIRAVIKKNASKQKTVMDIGCAIGKWIPVLAPAFKIVIAVDISAKNLELAKELHQSFQNVEYLRADMSGKKTKVPKCDFAICINAILTPDAKDRDVFFQSLSACVKKGGKIVLTIPSLESYLLTQVIQHRYKIDKKLFSKTTIAKEALRKWNNIRQGNVEIDNVPHKHYLEAELPLLFKEAGFSTESIQKIEYDWTTEFNAPIKKLNEPKPWDWMVVVQKN